MAYFVALVSAFLVISAATALRPGRRGVFAALAYPVGWAAGELAVQAIIGQAALLGLLWWWGWPKTHWLSVLIGILAAVVGAENFFLILISLYSLRLVNRALVTSPVLPLAPTRIRDDKFGSWWRTALQFPYHPRAMQLHKNIPYGPHQRNKLDVWRTSTTPTNAPVIMYVHGGSWIFGDKREQARPMLHEFVARGWIVVAINYRLAPKNLWPAHIEDVTRALGWVKKNIHSYGGDADRLVISGGSAGGHLAALAALTQNDPTWRPKEMSDLTDWSVRGAIPFYGVLEMTGDETHWKGLGKGLTRLLEKTVVKLPMAEHRDVYEQLSPMHRIHMGAPPFLVVQGSNDTLVDVNVARGFVARFREVALAPIYYVELPFTQHAFDVTASPRTSATTRAAVAFAESVTRPKPTLTPSLLANFRVPPTELEVKVSSGEWVNALDGARELGPFFVVTSDNPFSQLLSEEENEWRRKFLQQELQRRGVRFRHSRSRDGAGEWPTEYGFALLDVEVDFALHLGGAWEQFALYEVDEEAIRVRRVETGEIC